MKDDERELLQKLQRRIADDGNTSVRQLVADIGMHEKRAAYICEKWIGKGWYEYGVNVLAGWLTPEGINA